MIVRKKKDKVTKGQLILGVGFALLFAKVMRVIPITNLLPEGTISVGGLTDLWERLRA